MHLVQRLSVLIRCDHCGTDLRLRMTGRHDGDLIRVRCDPTDHLMQHLFVQAHQGPFTPRSVR